MSETTPLIKAALNLRVGVGFDVYVNTRDFVEHIGLPVNRSGIPYMYILKMERLYVMMLKRY